MDRRNNQQPSCSLDNKQGERGKPSKHRHEKNGGSWKGQKQPSLSGLRTGEAPRSRGDLRRDARVPNATRFPGAETSSGAGAKAGPPVSSRRRSQPCTARPHSPVDPVPPLPAGNASHAALHRSAPRDLPRPTSGDALDHREASVLVVSKSLRCNQARKRPRPGSSPARRTTKATGNLAFPEERKPRSKRPVLGAVAGRGRTGGWVKRHLAVGGTQAPPVTRTPFHPCELFL